LSGKVRPSGLGVKHRLGLFSENRTKVAEKAQNCPKLQLLGLISAKNAENPAAQMGNGVCGPKLRLQPQQLT
jgi:hypothetical protein